MNAADYCILFFCLIAIVLACGGVAYAVSPYEIDKDYWFFDEHTIKTSDGKTYGITEMKRYNVTGRVGAIKYYRENIVPFSPVDFCIGSGKLADPAYNESLDYSVDFSMNYRECRFQYKRGPQYKSGTGLGWGYTFEHITNNHIIPSNKEVFDKLMDIEVGDIIEMRGTLVSVSGSNLYPWISGTSDALGWEELFLGCKCKIIVVDYIEVIGFPEEPEKLNFAERIRNIKLPEELIFAKRGMNENRSFVFAAMITTLLIILIILISRRR